MDTVYLDNAATTQLDIEVISAMHESMQTNFGNPSSTHAFGRKAKAALENARKSISALLHVPSSSIVFTSGGTEADNTAINCAVRDLGVTRIISSKIEHHAVLNCVEFLDLENRIKLDFVNLDEHGSVDLSHLETLLKSDTDSKTLVSLMHINNEIGNILDLKAVGELCHTYAAYFHSDTVQSVGHYEMNLSQLPVDFIAVSAHKFHGPKGAGFMYVRNRAQLKPLIHGGSQERELRAGTESIHNIVGLQKAMELAYANLEKEATYIKSLKSYFISSLKEAISGIRFNGHSGDLDKSTYTLVNVSIPLSQAESDMMLFQLDLKGIACSKGSACQSGAQLGSFVLNEVYGKNLDYPGLRFSFSKYTTKEELDYVVSTLKSLSTSKASG
ncbi:cysteine sulfinate desulfinase/cysteine desulfurase [Psychroflexus torquis ATCC 700755]|uniref:cysteine desulfurase n=1 Tax=Psychroflexus torquis (strain ATCC 700755 / CIP 106069 / ACAM 623) TaxID=313595 RepID=K4ILF3_PSYTT|nr:cysteine desulfurase family protein [Psychroflexus torquis]AFU69906.1 cysteine sulfinate desulfinase/cysteine desulfurase [Psychroflexus torquis ATCC 700755]